MYVDIIWEALFFNREAFWWQQLQFRQNSLVTRRSITCAECRGGTMCNIIIIWPYIAQKNCTFITMNLIVPLLQGFFPALCANWHFQVDRLNNHCFWRWWWCVCFCFLLTILYHHRSPSFFCNIVMWYCKIDQRPISCVDLHHHHIPAHTETQATKKDVRHSKKNK